jgi:hypothetical protein
MLHKDLIGDEAVHPAAFKASADPGAVGAGKFWIDTSVGPPYTLKVRDAADTGWELVGTLGADPIDVSAATNGQFLKRVGGEWVGADIDQLQGEVVDLAGATNGQVLMRVLGEWLPVDLTGADIDAGSIDVDRMDATGTPDNTTFLRGDGVWATPAGGGGSSFPDDSGAFGTPTADDEEWDSDLSAWTVAVDVTGAANSKEVNGTFAPSRLRVRLTSTTGDTLKLTKALTVSASSDIAITFDASGIFNGNYRHVEMGFSDSATLSGADGMTGILQYSTNPQIIRRKYTNISALTLTDQATVTLTDGDEPRRFFLHLQRVSNVWSLWYSVDGVAWNRAGGTTTDSFTISHIYISMGGAASAGGSAPNPPFYLANHWVRLNRFFLG